MRGGGFVGWGKGGGRCERWSIVGGGVGGWGVGGVAGVGEIAGKGEYVRGVTEMGGLVKFADVLCRDFAGVVPLLQGVLSGLCRDFIR